MSKTRKLNDLSLFDIVPSSISQDLQIKALIQALDPELKLITGQINESIIFARIDELPELVLDYLAWQLHLDFYDLANDISAKREQIKNSILWHMHKGTKWAILKALDMIGVDGEIINWYEEPDGNNAEPYTFRVNATIRDGFFKAAEKDNIFENIIRAINESKAARSYLTSLQARLLRVLYPNFFAGMALGHFGEIFIKLAEIEGTEFIIHAGGFEQFSGSAIIYPSRPDDQEINLHAAIGESWSQSFILGVDLDDMQDLLEKFAERFMKRLDTLEAELMMFEYELTKLKRFMNYNEINQ